MSFNESLTRWAAAIGRESTEHGRPNSFGVGALALAYGLSRESGYYIGRKRLFDLWQALGGRESWGSQPTYKNGWFFV